MIDLGIFCLCGLATVSCISSLSCGGSKFALWAFIGRSCASLNRCRALLTSEEYSGAPRSAYSLRQDRNAFVASAYSSHLTSLGNDTENQESDGEYDAQMR